MAEKVADGKTRSASGSSEKIALEADALIKRYKNSTIPALDNFTLQVKQGEFFGLLGPNGAGKTTAISILSNLFSPDHGTVKVMGGDFKEYSTKIKKILGLVPQELALYDNLTARENLAFFGRLCGMKGKHLQNRVETSINFAGLAQRADRRVATYSGGMKRRLNLAAGLLHDPEILFLDEPTVGIDTQSRHMIHEQLLELNRAGMTILYTTHYMEEAQELCSRVGIMDGGKIIRTGKPDELLRQGGCSHLEELFLRLTGRQLRDT
jgi:ABC-2 type transport system ATP-binding protein